MRLSQKKIEVHPSVQLAFNIANKEACLCGSSRIYPVHFLLAILRIVDDNYDEAAEDMNLTTEELQAISDIARECRAMIAVSDQELTTIRRGLRHVLQESGGEPLPIHRLHRSADTHYLFQKATGQVVKTEKNELNIAHLLSELLAKLPEQATPFFAGTPARAAERPAPPSNGSAKDYVAAQDEYFEPALSSSDKRNSTPMIDEIGRDLTALAREHRLQSVIGLRAQMTQLVRYLQRTSKRNVIIIGEAGVGKTAIVEGLAQRLVGENIPDFLRALRIVQINVPDLLSGARYRGDMEERVQQIIAEASADPNLVLFFDEIHLVMKAGAGSEAPLDIASILKPALAREDFRCIGATTTEEFERYIKNDAAFMRRFQVLRLTEPTEEEAILICREWARRIENIQEVEFDDEAIEAAVRFSAQLIHGRSLPDKAIDVLENAASYVKIASLSFSNALPTKTKPHVGREQIKRILEQHSGITVHGADILDTAKVEEVLAAKLVGQDEVIASLLDSLKVLGLRREEGTRPLGVFLFTGPTGSGKTLTAECIAEALWGKGEKAIGRFNMNEYKERHELARLIGAPPGFVGHDHPGSLFQFVSEHPQGVILLDEMEKAHPEIHDYFLQLFDKGKTRDGRGRWVDFRGHLFIMTTNLAVAAGAERQIGFMTDNEKTAVTPREIGAQLSQHFQPEFLARIDRILSFAALSPEDYRELLRRHLLKLQVEIRQHYAISLEVQEEVQNYLCENYRVESEGARGFIREFERTLILPLYEYLQSASPTGIVKVYMNGTHVAFQ